jgi:hypothetical protein
VPDPPWLAGILWPFSPCAASSRVSTTAFEWAGGELVVVDRPEAEAIYDSGLESCIAFLMRIADREAWLEE